MENHKRRHSHQPWVGIILIVLGVLFLADALNLAESGRILHHWWPLILIIGGLIKLSSDDKNGGLIMLIVGGLFLLSNLHIIHWNVIGRLWPIVLILVGFSMLLGRNRMHKYHRVEGIDNSTDDSLKITTIFGATERVIHSNNFIGGEVTATFGNAEIDLSSVKISPQGCHLALDAIFGSIEIRVPSNIQVKISGTPIFGGIDNKTQNIATGSQIMHCHCSAIFGSIDIKN